MFWVLVGLLGGAGEGVTPPAPTPQLGAGWGFYPTKKRKTKFDEEVEKAEEAMRKAAEVALESVEEDDAPIIQITLKKRDEVIVELPPLDYGDAIRDAAMAYTEAMDMDDEEAINAIFVALEYA